MLPIVDSLLSVTDCILKQFSCTRFISCLLTSGAKGPDTVKGLGLLEVASQFWPVMGLYFQGGGEAHCPPG